VGRNDGAFRQRLECRQHTGSQPSFTPGGIRFVFQATRATYCAIAEKRFDRPAFLLRDNVSKTLGRKYRSQPLGFAALSQ